MLVERVCEWSLSFLWLVDICGKGECWWQISQIRFSLKSIKLLSFERHSLAAATQLTLREKKKPSGLDANSGILMLEGRACLHVSPDHISDKTRVRRAIDCVPLCWGKSLQCWLTREFRCSLTLHSWLRHMERLEICPNLLPGCLSLPPVQGISTGNSLHPVPHCRGQKQPSLGSIPTSPQQELFSFHPGVTKFTLVQTAE